MVRLSGLWSMLCQTYKRQTILASRKGVAPCSLSTGVDGLPPNGQGSAARLRRRQRHEPSSATGCDTQKRTDLAPRKRVRCNPMFGGPPFTIICYRTAKMSYRCRSGMAVRRLELWPMSGISLPAGHASRQRKVRSADHGVYSDRRAAIPLCAVPYLRRRRDFLQRTAVPRR